MPYGLFQTALSEAASMAGLRPADAMRNLAAAVEMSKLPTREDVVAGSRSSDGFRATAGAPVRRSTAHSGSGAVGSGNARLVGAAAVGSLSGTIPRMSRAGNEASQVRGFADIREGRREARHRHMCGRPHI